MTVIANCPYCGQDIELSQEHSGMDFDCPNCQRPLKAPALASFTQPREAAPRAEKPIKGPLKQRSFVPPRPGMPTPAGRGAYISPPPKKTGGGVGRLLFLLVLLGGAVFCLLSSKYEETP